LFFLRSSFRKQNITIIMWLHRDKTKSAELTEKLKSHSDISHPRSGFISLLSYSINKTKLKLFERSLYEQNQQHTFITHENFTFIRVSFSLEKTSKVFKSHLASTVK